MQDSPQKPPPPPDMTSMESLAVNWRPSRREAIEMRWASLWRRGLLLRRTAALTLQQHGPLHFVLRSARWLRGERGYWANLAHNASGHGPQLSGTGQVEPYEPAEGDFLHYRFAGHEYALHARLHEPDDAALRAQQNEAAQWPSPPLLSVVTPVYNPPLAILHELIFSLQHQTWPHWEWIAADSSSDPAIWAALADASAGDPRIRPLRLERNLGISGNTNAALEQAAGEFVVLLDHDDTLAANALYAIAGAVRANPGVDFIYSDEDKLNEFNRRCNPFLKPGWSPELLLSGNYLIHVAAFRRALLAQVGLFDPGKDGAQDWDFFLRVSEVTEAIVHIPEVLYHWRMSEVSTAGSHTNKPYVQVAQQRAVQQHLERQGLKNPVARFLVRDLIYGVHPVSQWDVAQPSRISIIIPTRNRANLLKRCLATLLTQTTWPDFEVILVDSGSTDLATLTFYTQIQGDRRVRVIPYGAGAFNFSRACNQGAASATGSLLLFLNNDVEVLQGDWLHGLAQWFELPGVGIVGPQLLYPNGKIQHAGIVLGLLGMAGHVFAGSGVQPGGVFGSTGWYRNVLAVTGACLMIRRPLFEELGGFDEAYQMDFSDVALCVRARAKGWRTVYTPLVQLIHHESASRAPGRLRADVERAGEEFRPVFAQGDPYFNPGLSPLRLLPTLRQDEPAASELVRALIDALPAGGSVSPADLTFTWKGDTQP